MLLGGVGKVPFQRDVPKEFHSCRLENGKIIPQIEVVWGKWEPREIIGM